MTSFFVIGYKEPSAIVTVVGGGGLAAGILMGMERVGWACSVPLLTMETQGADCFNKAIGSGRIVRLEAIKSVATSLGAQFVIFLNHLYMDKLDIFHISFLLQVL